MTDADKGRQEIAKLRERADDGRAAVVILSELCAIVPLNDTLKATQTGRALIDYFKETISQAAAAKQRIAELEVERDSTITWIRVVIEELANAGGKSGDRTVALENLRTLIRERASDRRTGFMECQRQAVEAARNQNDVVPLGLCCIGAKLRAAEAISLLEPDK